MSLFRPVASCLTIALILDGAAIASQDQVRNVAGVSYVSGGVGEESRTSLQSQAAQFNVQVVFALKSGEYLADVDVAVRDASGRTLFSTVTDGPWLYARLAPGSYEISATVDGRQLTQKFTVPSQGLRQLVFRWADA